MATFVPGDDGASQDRTGSGTDGTEGPTLPESSSVAEP
jgi:hypothetical protein